MNTAQRGGRGRVLAIAFFCKEQRPPTSHETAHSEMPLALSKCPKPPNSYTPKRETPPKPSKPPEPLEGPKPLNPNPLNPCQRWLRPPRNSMTLGGIAQSRMCMLREAQVLAVTCHRCHEIQSVAPRILQIVEAMRVVHCHGGQLRHERKQQQPLGSEAGL